MSICKFIASDIPLEEFAPAREYPLRIDIDRGTVDDGGADDNYHLLAFDSVGEYTDREYGVELQWHYTEGRAKRLIEYIKAALRQTDSIELWSVWLMGYYEYDERPFIHRKTISIEELTPAHIEELDRAEIWNSPDKRFPHRPSFYCLTVTA